MGGFSKNWLALDGSRLSFKPPHVCVLINTTGSYIRKGFSCKDAKQVMQLINQHAKPSAEKKKKSNNSNKKQD